MRIAIERPELPKDEGSVDPLAAAAEWANEHDVRPAITSAFAKSRSDDISILVKCMERVHRLGNAMESCRPCGSQRPPAWTAHSQRGVR